VSAKLLGKTAYSILQFCVSDISSSAYIIL